ncbi:hypothetical protein FPT12_06600 [Pseudomonas sp. H3(2019)]|nr:hypothetical protein FPT12_06600 [Pseudomonas sp. H3(2019)]
MSGSPTPAQNTHKGRHYAFIKNTLSENFKTATVGRGKALTATALKMEPWYTTAPAAHHDQLKAANLKAWGSQNQVDKLFEKLQDIHSFAAPLLQEKLKEKYGIADDVKTTYLRLYLPANLPWYTINVSVGVTTRTVSLLDAALHNFAKTETVGADSQFITQPDKRGHFDVLPIKQKMTISQFQALCRELDIGALYKAHLESFLLPGEPVAEAVMKLKVSESQKDALTVAAQLALMTGDIQYDAYKLMLDLAKDEPRLLLNGRQMLCCDLSMMETRLTGIVLLIPAVRDSRGLRRLIAYVPHDPDHPLKEYESPDAFMNELSRQLREDKIGTASQRSYRQFFSQFVDQQQRGHFFADLDRRLLTVRWHEKTDLTDQSPTWREDPVSRPHLQFQHLPIQRDYWTHAYQQKLNKILNDAREIAVSTADTDSKARWAWWDNFKKIVSDIFNVALLIATPFVPGLGELMMAYTVYQLSYDVIEGIVDLAEGLGLEAAEHVISVVTDVIQLAAFGAGAEIGSAFKLKLSPLVEGMKPVRLPDGKQTLWHPDLEPYEQKNLSLSADSKPDKHGLHQHADQQILPLDGKLYFVEKSSKEPISKTHRIKHPTRPGAYSPKVEHNGHGAWVHEAENPVNWEGETLMRRLGHSVDRFSPTELEQIRISSGTDDNVLRRMHVENAPPPPVLADTIKRFSAYDETRIASANIRRGRPIEPSSVWFEPMMTSLPGWPSERALKVFENADLTGNSRQYGNANATEANTLSMSLADLTSGQLPERVLGFLNETEIKALLGRDVPSAGRLKALRDQLADAVDGRKGEISKRLYQAGERSSKAEVRLLRQPFPDMPLPLAETVLTNAKAAERTIMVDENRLPLRLKTQARELNFEAGTARAYDGFYRDELVVPDTERLALNTLKFNTDGFGDLRIEVFDGTYDGTLRCSVGPDDASTVRRLIRDEHGKYEVLDGANKKLHEAGDFYESLLRALPDDKRTALGYRRGQGRLLKLWVMEKSEPAAERRTLLAEPPIRRVADIETVNLVRGPALSKTPKTPEDRVKNLYPNLSEQEARTFVEALRAKGDPDQAIDQLRDEVDELRNTLAEWENKVLGYVSVDSGPGKDYSDFRSKGGRHIRERLLECFERKSKVFGERSSHPEGGYTLNLSTEFTGPNLDRWWADLREQANIKKYLDQVTVLSLDNARFSPDDTGLLNDFTNLRHLSARQCGLTGVPSTIGQMRHLETLDLVDNRISLTPDSAEQLSGLTRLQTLNLNGNPLRQPPDVGRMYRLNELSLANTGIQTWPEGLFKVGAVNKNRPRGFMLDMRQSPINALPKVTPGSDQAFVLSRARFDTAKLSDADRTRYGNYRQSVGFFRQQAYSPAVRNEIANWQSFPEESVGFSPSVSFTKYREESWQDVMAEPRSDGFFSIIRKQRESADYQFDRSRRQLTKRVWEMIDAVALDSELREELFKQVLDPKSCEDGGVQLFNSMGMKVLVSQAYAKPTSAKALDNELARLARSAARLSKVGDAAREEIGRQEQQHLINPRNLAPDDVEVHLAFETGLSGRLELPWRSEGMRYQLRSGVDETKINAAYDAIIDREKGDGLVNGMIDLFSDPFWERHLRRTHPTQYEINDRLFEAKPGLLDDLREAQAEWASSNAQTRPHQLARRMENLADQLGIPQADVFSGEAMSQARYDGLLEDIGYARNDLSRKLTREALARAGL